MQLTLRNMAPALMVLTLALAGCKTAPTKNAGDAAATPQTGQQQQQQQSPSATASVVEFYVARTQAGPGLTEVTLPDGKLYMEQQPVLTRADLTEAAQLVDREGNNFVGLRFSESGARKLNDISSKNVGNMLVLVLDRELIAAPRIGEPLNRGVLAFGVPSAKAAADIASRIRGDSSAPAAGGSPATAPVTAPAAKPLSPARLAGRAWPAARDATASAVKHKAPAKGLCCCASGKGGAASFACGVASGCDAPARFRCRSAPALPACSVRPASTRRSATEKYSERAMALAGAACDPRAAPVRPRSPAAACC